MVQTTENKMARVYIWKGIISKVEVDVGVTCEIHEFDPELDDWDCPTRVDENGNLWGVRTWEGERERYWKCPECGKDMTKIESLSKIGDKLYDPARSHNYLCEWCGHKQDEKPEWVEGGE